MPRRRTIPGEALEVRYRRSGPQAGKYFHPFKPGVKMYANADGSVTLRGRQRIHAEDTEPGFWQRYGHGRGRNPMARTKILGIDATWLLLGAAAFLWYRQQRAPGAGGVGIPQTVDLPDGSSHAVQGATPDGMILTTDGWQSMVLPSGAEQWVNVHTGAVMDASGALTSTG